MPYNVFPKLPPCSEHGGSEGCPRGSVQDATTRYRHTFRRLPVYITSELNTKREPISYNSVDKKLDLLRKFNCVTRAT